MANEIRPIRGTRHRNPVDIRCWTHGAAWTHPATAASCSWYHAWDSFLIEYRFASGSWIPSLCAPKPAMLRPPFAGSCLVKRRYRSHQGQSLHVPFWRFRRRPRSGTTQPDRQYRATREAARLMAWSRGKWRCCGGQSPALALPATRISSRTPRQSAARTFGSA